MRSRSALEWSGLTLGAVAQSVWLAVLGAALSGTAWPRLAVFITAVMLVTTAVVRWAAGRPLRLARGRFLLVAVLLAAVAALFVAGRGWDHPYVAWQILRDAVFATFAVVLGVRLGRDDTGPDEAFSRAGRAFAALCVVLLLGVITATPLHGQVAAVATSVVAGGLHVAVVRYRALGDAVSDDDRLPLWPWLLALGAVIAAILVVAGLVVALVDKDSARSALGGVWDVFGYVGVVVGYIGAGVMRAFAWLAGLVHLHFSPPQRQPSSPGVPSMTTRHHDGASPVVSFLGYAGIAVAVTVAAVTVVAFALRRLRVTGARDDAVVEERESLRSVTSATAETIGGLRRRLRDLVRSRGQGRTPAEEVRLRYARLERRLARAGSPRAAGTTVREHLAACAGPAESDPARELASVYELARYSDRAVDEGQARRFGELAAVFGVRAAG